MYIRSAYVYYNRLLTYHAFSAFIFSSDLKFEETPRQSRQFPCKARILSTIGAPWDPDCLWLHECMLYASVSLIRIGLPAVSPGHALGCET